MSGTYAARTRGFLGGFLLNKRRSFPLCGSTKIIVSPDDIRIEADYEPSVTPGIALLFGALGYLFFRMVRRTRLSFSLLPADAVLIDVDNRRFAFHIHRGIRLEWVAFELAEGFDEVSQAIKTLMPGKVTAGKIMHPVMWPVIMLIVIVLAVLAIIIWTIVVNTCRY